jgi:hypothetical protein
MIVDAIDDRILGAVRFLDAETRLPIQAALAVASTTAGVTIRKNGLGHHVIAGAPGLAAFAGSSSLPPPARPTPASFGFTVADPGGRWLPRAFKMALPRDPAPANAGNADSVFSPALVSMFPSPSAPAAAGSALVRVSVTDQTGAPLGGALVRVIAQADGSVKARGLTDARGEGLVLVPGIPVTSWSAGTGPVLSTAVDVTVEASYDPAARGVAGYVPDPDDLEARIASLAKTTTPATTLASAEEVSFPLSITLP